MYQELGIITQERFKELMVRGPGDAEYGVRNASPPALLPRRRLHCPAMQLVLCAAHLPGVQASPHLDTAVTTKELLDLAVAWKITPSAAEFWKCHRNVS
jgi:hypothetical protein